MKYIPTTIDDIEMVVTARKGVSHEYKYLEESIGYKILRIEQMPSDKSPMFRWNGIGFPLSSIKSMTISKNICYIAFKG